MIHWVLRSRPLVAASCHAQIPVHSNVWFMSKVSKWSQSCRNNEAQSKAVCVCVCVSKWQQLVLINSFYVIDNLFPDWTNSLRCMIQMKMWSIRFFLLLFELVNPDWLSDIRVRKKVWQKQPKWGHVTTPIIKCLASFTRLHSSLKTNTHTHTMLLIGC